MVRVITASLKRLAVVVGGFIAILFLAEHRNIVVLLLLLFMAREVWCAIRMGPTTIFLWRFVRWTRGSIQKLWVHYHLLAESEPEAARTLASNLGDQFKLVTDCEPQLVLSQAYLARNIIVSIGLVLVVALLIRL